MANGKVVANTYDAIGRISSKKIGSYTTTLSYLAGINGSQTERLASYKNGSDNAYQYTYDANGNITHIQQGTNHVYYQYDALNQLVREDNSTTGKSVVYTYDANGNILQKSEHAYVANGGELGEATNTILYGYEAEHQNWADQLTSYNGEAIRYDGIGNPTTYRGYTMSWLGRRLTSASGNGNTLSYTYDENGLRAQKTVNGTATQYRYHGTTLLSQVKGNDKLLFSYDVNGDVAAVNFNGTYYYYLRNAQGDIVKIIDGNNNSVVEYTYDTWGKVLSCTGSLSSTLGAQNPFRYRGYVYDEETGFYYLQSRYYDPEVGRFLNADSVDNIGANQSLLAYNIFAYCDNNPIIHADDNGEALHVVVGAIIGGVFGALNAALNGENVLAGAITGSISGGLSAALGPAAGMVISAGESLVNGIVNGNSAKDIVKDMAISAVTSFTGSKISNGLGKLCKETLNPVSRLESDIRKIGNKIFKKIEIKKPVKTPRHFAAYQFISDGLSNSVGSIISVILNRKGSVNGH